VIALRQIGALILVFASAAACHVSPRPAQVTGPASSAPSTLTNDIDSIVRDAAFAHSYWAVLVRSLKNDDTLYALNAGKLLIPASNMKIVTLAAAAERLGWEYVYTTRLLAAGRVTSGRLDGDLLAVGSGDPSIGLAGGKADALFADWASRLKAAGISSVAGRVIGDDNTFDDEELGFGWSWDDLPDDYAAGVSALQFNENAVRVTISPAVAVGDFAGIAIEPVASGLIVDGAITTSAADAPTRIVARRLPGSSHLELSGSIPLGAAPAARVVSVDNPTIFFASSLRRALIAQGIDVRGAAVDIDDISDAPPRSGAVEVAAYTSPPLSTLAIRLMKDSLNLYAETFLKTVGAAAGTPTYVGGRTQVQAALEPWGVRAGDLIDRDGSGLSRYDYVTPAALVTILTHIDRDAKLRAPFVDSLPIAGRDGSLANRMKGTAAEGNARAKTGSMSNVRALSGYVTSADGEPLVFSMIANNFETPPDVVTKAMDAIVVKLAEFRR